jgi:transposase
MAKAYSADLRKKVMLAVDSGQKQRSIARNFSISEKTIYLWIRQRDVRGHIRPITKYQKGHSHKIGDIEKFKKFVLINSSMTSAEMANAWGNITKTTIKKHLKIIGFTRKKNIWVYQSERRKEKGI